MAVAVEVAPDQLETDRKLRGSLELYCRTLIKIRDKGGKIRPFYWKRAQRELHDRLERQMELTGRVRALVLKGRRMGISTYIGARGKHRTDFRTGHEAFIMTHREDATSTLFNMVKLMQKHMLPEYRTATVKNNDGEMVMAGTDSIYRVATAGGDEIGRSMNNQFFHGSELAFWANAAKHFASAVETVPDMKDTEIILESTANGVGGEFYDRWQLAEQGKGDYIAVFLPWFWDDDYRREPPPDWTPPGDWAEYQELYDLDLDQVYWAYNRNINLGGDEGERGYVFMQEYPANAEEAFQTSATNSLIKAPAVIRARKTVLDLDQYEPLIFGVDIAATDGIAPTGASAAAKQAIEDQKGKGDSTRLISRQGRVAGRINEVWMDSDSAALADNIALLIREHRPDKVFVDKTGGYGWGIVGHLNRAGFGDIVVGINFGEKATEEEKYKNKRAEMWGRMKEWLDDFPADIPDDNSLHRQLCSATWKPDMKRRIQLEEKELIKKRLKFSPDIADALGLTFAQIVDAPQKRKPEWMKEAINQRRYNIDPMTR